MSDERLHVWWHAEQHKHDGTIIPDGVARTIAAWWHSPADPALAALSSTGTIMLDEVLVEIDQAVRVQEREPGGEAADAVDELKALRAYAIARGERGRVEGWASLWADKCPIPGE